ncbi:transglycosylase SLT domain-containing protein [Streptomyces chryseus]
MPAQSLNPAARTVRIRKFSVSALCAAGAAAVALSVAPSPAHAAAPAPQSVAASAQVSAAGVFAQADAIAAQALKAEKAAKAAKAEKVAKAEKADKAAKAKKAASYPDNLDGWIREALAIMKDEGIPGSYEGLHRNIMRESGGDPEAANDWDINAQNGTPSKGLLQVIQPTFDAYHVEGTPKELTDPVANITAAANYAADRYGSIDNVDSAY